MKDQKNNRIWAISLMILGGLSLIIGVTSIVGFEIPHLFRIIIAAVQIVVGTVFIIATVLKFKKREADSF